MPAARVEDPLLRGLTDDLRLAHLLADDADSITMSRFKALDLQVNAKPDLTPGDRRRHRGRGVAAPHARPGPAARRRARRGDVGHRLGPAPLGDRPDRRHQELRPRRPRLGHPDLADDQRRGGGRRGQRTRARPALVGQPGRRGVRRQVADVARRVPRLAGRRDRGRLAQLRRDRRVGRRRPGPGVRRPAPQLLAHPGVRGLLVLRAAGRGWRRHRLRARPRALRHGRLLDRRHRGRRVVHRPRRQARVRSAPARTRPTGCCTRRSSPSCGPTADDDSTAT